jgi:hypothetical protein
MLKEYFQHRFVWIEKNEEEKNFKFSDKQNLSAVDEVEGAQCGCGVTSRSTPIRRQPQDCER